MKLQEIFNRPEYYEWTTKTETYGLCKFVVANGSMYKVIIDEIEADETGGTDCWAIQFEALPLDGERWTINNTNTGDELTVFSTVIAIVKDFMADNGVRSLYMQTSDNSRKSLYVRILGRLLPKWTIDVDGSQIFAVKPGDAVPRWDTEEDREVDFDRP